MTRAELAAVVVSNIGGRTDKTTVINNGLDFGLKHYTKLHDFKTRKLSVTTGTLTKGSGILTLDPSSTAESIRNVIEFRIIDGTESYPILKKTKEWVVSRFPNPAADNTAHPVYMYQEANVLHFVPFPDFNYSFEYTYIADELKFAADNTANPIYLLDEVLVAYATAYVFKGMQKFQEGAIWEADANEKFRAAVIKDKKTFTHNVMEGFCSTKSYSPDYSRAGVFPTSLES